MKRIVCFLLALIMVLGMIPNTVITANAASKRNISANAINILKGSMTFYEKVTGGKVGYSTPIAVADNEKYLNGISKEDATDLLRDYIEKNIDKNINDWTKSNNIDLQQFEHDALAVRMYRNNLDDKGVKDAIRVVKTVNSAADRAAMVEAFVSPYGQHNVYSSETLMTTLNVSLAEAAMYLYGDYGYNGNGRFAYTMLDIDGDKAADTFAAFVKGDGLTLEKPSAYVGGMADSQFLGWFLYDTTNKKETGAPISKLTSDYNGKLVVAKKATDDKIAAEYTINTKTLTDLNVYSNHIESTKVDSILKNNTEFKVSYEFLDASGVKWIYGTGKNTKNNDTTGWIKLGKMEVIDPSTDKAIATATVKEATLNVYPGATTNEDTTVAIGTLKKNDVVNVYETKVEKTNKGNITWGKISYNNIVGWIDLGKCDVNETLGESGAAKGQTGKIANADDVNIRSSAGISATNWIASLKRGTSVTVLGTYNNDTWAKIKWETPANGYTEGYVYMHYVQLDSAPAGSGAVSSETVKYTGVVTSNINLNVRKSADIYSTKVDSLPSGTKINIYETTTSRNMKWGRIGTNRWVCLTYVNMTEVQQSANGTGTTTTTSIQGTVTTATLNVLKNYNNNAEKVGTLKKGDVVTILEKNTETTETGSRIWGRISKDGVSGWINLAYVELKTVTSVIGGSTNNNTTAGTTNANGASAVVSNCISVNIREGAGTSNAQITKLKNGTAVKVYEQVTKDNAPWARITWENGSKSGWVCMNYVTINNGSAGTTTEGGLVNGTNSNTISATGVVNSNIDLNVRSIAGLNGIKLGSLKKGTKVTVYEQVSADGMIWGRIQYGNGSGWICMSYITVESATSTGRGVMGTIARCFAKVNVRSAPGTNNALINTIAVGSRVEVFETRTYSNQLWGRVAQGWICMDYVLLDSELPEGEILDAPTTAPSTEAPTVPQVTINKDNEVAYVIKGDVIATPELIVRNDADTDSDKIGTVKNGEKIEVLAVKNNGAELWGRIDQYATAGWINMAYVSYSVEGYINTDNQPVYADPSTSSTVKGTLTINTHLTGATAIQKLTLGGETVFGWYQDASVSGWIPMGRISKDAIVILPTYKNSTDAVGANDITGKTNAAITAYAATNNSKEVFYLTSGVTVYIGEIDLEAGVVWGKIKANGVEGWINLNAVTFTLPGTIKEDTNVYRTKAVAEDNILGDKDANKLAAATGVTICELSFDGNGALWGKLTGYAANSGEAILNGGYVKMSNVTTTIDIQTK